MRTQRTIYLTDADFDALHRASLILFAIAEAVGKDGKDFPFTSFDIETIAMKKNHNFEFMLTDFSHINGGIGTYAEKLRTIIQKEEQK